MIKKRAIKKILILLPAVLIVSLNCMIVSGNEKKISISEINQHRGKFKKYAENIKWWFSFSSETGALLAEGKDAAKTMCVAIKYFDKNHKKEFESAITRFGTEDDIKLINAILSMEIQSKNQLAGITYEKHIDLVSDLIELKNKEDLKKNPAEYAKIIKNECESVKAKSGESLLAQAYYRCMTIGLFCRYWLSEVEKRI